MLTAIAGANWGDEGKGRMVDLLSADYDIICRYQGGSNAGHTVINPMGKFVLNLIPVGILRDTTVNVMGGGMVIDIEHLRGEIDGLTARGINITPDNLKISHRAVICLPYHKAQDILEEDRLSDKKYGSTRRGIAPVYADKYMKKALRMEDLADFSSLAVKVRDILEWKNMLLAGYGGENVKTGFKEDEILSWLQTYGEKLLPFVTDTTAYLEKAIKDNKNILLEAQLGTLRDVEFGIYPYTTSSNVIAAYAPIGAGIPFAKLDNVLAVTKAYSSCVGEGPFAAEFFGEEAETLRKAGGDAGEYGAATGRPRRVGAFDIPATRFGVKMQGADYIALTNLDALAYLSEITVCVAYDIDGEITTDFPSGARLMRAKPVFEKLPGFKTDISGCRSAGSLPKAAADYVKYIENAVGVPIKYVSLGPKREDYLVMA